MRIPFVRSAAFVSGRAGRLRALGAALAAACACAVLAGCASAPLPKMNGDTPAEWQQANAFDNGPAPDLRSWWKAFNDAELDRLVERALSENLGIQQAVLRVEAARQLAGRSGAQFLPTFGAHTYAEPTPDSSASYFQMGFDAKWEFGFFGRSKNHARVSAADLGIAESDAQSALITVVAEVARSYVELRAAQQRLGLLEQLAAAAQQKVDLTATRVRLRLASTADLGRAEVEQASAQAALSEPRLVEMRARRQLAVLLGQAEPDGDLVAAGTPPQLGDLRIATAPADLLRTRPEIRRAESDVLKAAGERGLAQSDLFPHLGLGGSLTYAARVIGHTRLSDADGIVTFGPAIDIPLFDWGARRAVLDARDLNLRASVLAYRQSVLEGVAEAETAMATLEQQRERSSALGRGLGGLERDVGATATLSRLGMADGFDRTASQAALLQAKLEIARAEEAHSIAFIALYKSLGGAPLPKTATTE